MDACCESCIEAQCSSAPLTTECRLSDLFIVDVVSMMIVLCFFPLKFHRHSFILYVDKDFVACVIN